MTEVVSVDGYEAVVVCDSCEESKVLHMPNAWSTEGSVLLRCPCGHVLQMAVRWDNEKKRYYVAA